MRRDGVRTQRLVNVRMLRCSAGLVASGHRPTSGGDVVMEGEWLGVVRRAGLGYAELEI